MSEVERRRGYGYNRVLIESERILASEFDDAVVWLSGAQIEMLRNVTQYLNRLGTYAAEYNPGYYLVPTDEDFDDILEIVADMEEALMGNPNTIWGYKDTYSWRGENPNTAAGNVNLYGLPVPEGEVWRVFNASFATESASCTRITLYAIVEGVFIKLHRVDSPVSVKLYSYLVDVTLAEDDKIYILGEDMTLHDTLSLFLSGYQMDV